MALIFNWWSSCAVFNIFVCKTRAKFPTAGGPVEFLVKSWGSGTVSGGLNLFLWIGFVIAIALYAQGFSSYALTFFSDTTSPLVSKAVACGAVIFFTMLNMLGAGYVGKAETIIVAVKVTILVLFAGAGLFFIHPENLSIVHWKSY